MIFKKKDKVKSAYVLGLNIGAYAVKGVEVTHDGHHLRLHQLFVHPLPDDNPQSVLALVRRILEETSSESPAVRTSVSGPSVLIRRITMPLMTENELKSAIRFEAEGHIAFPLDDCTLDFQVLRQDAAKKNMDVMLAAAKRSLIDERLKLLADCGVTPESVDVDMFCVLNAFEVLADEQKLATTGLLDIGHRSSAFAILHDDVPFFVRDIPHGAEAVTQALAAAAAVPVKEADALKKGGGGVSAETLRDATLHGFENLIEEIRHSIDYFENESGEELKTVWLSGGGSRSVGAPEILSEELGRQVSLWDNTRKLEIPSTVDRAKLAEHFSELNVPLGMVLPKHVHRKAYG